MNQVDPAVDAATIDLKVSHLDQVGQCSSRLEGKWVDPGVDMFVNQLDLAVDPLLDQVNSTVNRVDPVAVDHGVEELDLAVDLTNPAVTLQRFSVALCCMCW